jgi:hypothetical protein
MLAFQLAPLRSLFLSQAFFTIHHGQFLDTFGYISELIVVMQQLYKVTFCASLNGTLGCNRNTACALPSLHLCRIHVGSSILVHIGHEIVEFYGGYSTLARSCRCCSRRDAVQLILAR